MGELQRQQQHLLYLVCFLWIGFPCCTGTTRAHSVKSARIRVDNKKGFPFDELSVRAPLFGLYKTVFLIKPKLAVSAFDKDADVDVIGHPILNPVYYMLAEIVPSALVLFILRKLPLRRVSDQYHYQPLS